MNKIALVMMVLLTSCSTVPISYVPICAPVKSYTKAEQVQLAAELKACGDKCKETKEFLKDGHVLRQASKECPTSK